MKEVVSVEGLSDLEAALGEFKPSTGKGVLRRVGKAAAKPMAADMSSRARRNTGELQLSCKVAGKLSRRQAGIHRKMFKDDRASVELFVGPGPLPQAIQEEFGNIHEQPHPFVRPAWDAGKTLLLKTIAEGLGKEIDKTAARLAARAARLIAKGK